ncbi:hypothetical protein EBB79_04810 [Parasedimentitalea marina]|uniref:Roadblock/LC7 domain-containing protein n=1 Tax=Parasedimentitalea marina TaxID=2483033 RepID=A0A3T0MZT3_9RHOB|nr:hypothetical protein [Parasedimentitalea marina]AZV77278.1 hypothetical protein EBB79_04810 [Parasedimentitalea marina]
MDITGRLHSLRETTPGCALVAFGDLSTQLVLRSSAAVQVRQEFLDQLCAQAEHGFCLQDALAGWNTPRGEGSAEVIVVTPQETRIYIRRPGAAQDTACDAILCVCDTESSARTLISPAMTLLHDLSEGA